jgi:hypothetical protein
LRAKRGIPRADGFRPAGFQLRGYLASAIPADQIRQIYIPDIPGKEKRKVHAGKAGLLGVEGMDTETLRRAFEAAGVGTDSGEERPVPLSKACLYELGLSGARWSHCFGKDCERTPPQNASGQCARGGARRSDRRRNGAPPLRTSAASK